MRELIFSALDNYPYLGPTAEELVQLLLASTGYGEIELEAAVYAALDEDWIFMSNGRLYLYPEGI